MYDQVPPTNATGCNERLSTGLSSSAVGQVATKPAHATELASVMTPISWSAGTSACSIACSIACLSSSFLAALERLLVRLVPERRDSDGGLRLGVERPSGADALQQRA